MENTNDNQKIRDYIEKESTRFATANTYRIDNPYLSQSQKLEVELWFQFPSTVLFISLCGMMIYSIFNPIASKLIFGVPFLIDLVLGMVNWNLQLKNLLKGFFLTIGHNFVLWGLAVSTIALLIYHGHYWYAGIVLIGKFGILSIISPSMFTYTILSRKYKMHAKWVFFKRFYGHEFPFEKEIESPN